MDQTNGLFMKITNFPQKKIYPNPEYWQLIKIIAKKKKKKKNEYLNSLLLKEIKKNKHLLTNHVKKSGIPILP